MAAVPIYVWNGTAWQETGPTIPANPIKYQTTAPSSPSTGDIWVDSDGDVTTGSQQFQRFRFVASGGETSISGADANGAVLAYTAGLEQVVLNGAVLVRGHDYTATDGTTITGLSPALVASDVLEVFSFIAFTVANTYTQSQVDGFVTSLGGTNTAWTSYTPTWTNLTVGNATQAFRYKQIGKTVFVQGLITLGSTSSVTGLIQFTNPVNQNSSNLQCFKTDVLLYRGAFFGGVLYPNGADKWYVRAINTASTYAGVSDTSSTVPGTWTTGDFITVSYFYEAA
jgi:hypothetical protein